MEIEFRDIEVKNNCLNPSLRMSFKLKFANGREALINTFGDLVSYDKIIGRLELGSDKSSLNFNINAMDSTNNNSPDSSPYDLFLDCEINKIAIDFINNSRKKAEKTDIKLTAKVNILYVYSTTSSLTTKELVGKPLGNNAHLLSSSTGFSYLGTRNEIKSIPITIKASDWINDFAPKFGLGEFEIIEIPKIKADGQTEKFKDALKALEESKKQLYSLSNGSSMTALRNSLNQFNSVLVVLGYKKKDSKDRDVVDYSKIFPENENIAKLADELQRGLSGSSSRGDESTAAHTGLKIEGYEIESMISMTYSLYKMVFGKLKEIEDLEAY